MHPVTGPPQPATTPAHDEPDRDCSTVSPALSGELASAFPARFLAVPVIGSPLAVRAGQAVYLAGGNGGLVDRLAPVLSSLSSTVRRYDTAPLALTAKLVNNLLLLSQVIALAEAFAVVAAGVSPTTSSASCWAAVPWSRLG